MDTSFKAPDNVGEYTQADDGRYQFVYGPLVIAMTEGRVLFIDDATLISPKVLAVVYPAMDGRRQLTVKAHKGETIAATEGFYVVAGHRALLWPVVVLLDRVLRDAHGYDAAPLGGLLL